MSNFRTTLWFKKGELDALAAHDPEGPGAVDLLPIEDRYDDDGSLAGTDTSAFSLATGDTQAIQMMKETREIQPVSAPPPELIRELKGNRMHVIAAISAAVMMVVMAVYAF